MQMGSQVPRGCLQHLARQAVEQRIREEQRTMDEKIVLELDRKVADQQSTLEKAGVAGFYVTSNPQVSILPAPDTGPRGLTPCEPRVGAKATEVRLREPFPHQRPAPAMSCRPHTSLLPLSSTAPKTFPSWATPTGGLQAKGLRPFQE